MTALMMHMKKSVDNNVLEIFVNNGANINMRTNKGKNLLYMISLSREKDFCVLKTLINKYKIDINNQDNELNTFLHKYINKSYVTFTENVLQDLINAGFNLNIQNNNGDTVLHIASKYAHKFIIFANVMDLIIEAKFDPTIRNEDGNTFLHILCDKDVFYRVNNNSEYVLTENVLNIFRISTNVVNTQIINYDNKTPIELFLKHNKLSTQRECDIYNILLSSSNHNINNVKRAI